MTGLSGSGHQLLAFYCFLAGISVLETMSPEDPAIGPVLAD